MKKPPYPFCWWCSRKLWGRKVFALLKSPKLEAPVSVHKQCAADMLELGEGWERTT